MSQLRNVNDTDPRICPNCRVPIWQDLEHECGHNEWRFLIVREGLPAATAVMTTNMHELPALHRDLTKTYGRTEPAARIVVQRRWVDGWSVVDLPDEGTA